MYFPLSSPGLGNVLTSLAQNWKTLLFPLGKVCYYQCPGQMSSVPTEVNCSFPESLCFKYSNKSVKDGQFTAQGCISAELCRKLDNQKGLECCHGDLCNTGEAGKAQNPCSKELQFGCCAQYIKPYSVWPRVRLFWNRLATIMFIIKFKAHSGWLIKRARWELNTRS